MVAAQQRTEGRHFASMPSALEEASPGRCRECRLKERKLRKRRGRRPVRCICHSLLTLQLCMAVTADVSGDRCDTCTRQWWTSQANASLSCSAVLLPSAVALDEYERLLRKGPTKPRSKRKVGDRWVCDVFPRGCVYKTSRPFSRESDV